MDKVELDQYIGKLVKVTWNDASNHKDDVEDTGGGFGSALVQQETYGLLHSVGEYEGYAYVNVAWEKTCWKRPKWNYVSVPIALIESIEGAEE